MERYMLYGFVAMFWVLLLVVVVFLFSCGGADINPKFLGKVLFSRTLNENEKVAIRDLAQCMDEHGLNTEDVVWPQKITIVRDLQCGDIAAKECLLSVDEIAVDESWIGDILTQVRHAIKHSVIFQISGDFDRGHKSMWFDSFEFIDGEVIQYQSPCPDRYEEI
jgi:hypothetical protein